MFTPKQRTDILKWGSLTFVCLVCLASLSHGLFFVMLFQYYLPGAIIAAAIYFGYTRAKTIQVTDDQIKHLFHTKILPLVKKQ